LAINKIVLEHQSAWKIKLSASIETWPLPYAPYFKINFDTTIRDNLSAQAAVCEDSIDHFIKGFSYIRPPCDLISGEALAALWASHLAISLDLSHFILESDLLIVALTLQRLDITQDWQIVSTIFAIISSVWQRILILVGDC
jgi:hypothetical protein